MSEVLVRPRPRRYVSRALFGLTALISSSTACGGEEVPATAASVKVTPVTEVYEWPLETHESKPDKDYLHVKDVDDSGMKCSLNMDGEIECKWKTDTDYEGYTKNRLPLRSGRGESQTITHDFVSLNGSPLLDMPRDDEETVHTRERYYDLEMSYFTPSSILVQSCVSRVSALTFDNSSAGLMLEATGVREVERFSERSLLFLDEAGQQLISFGCSE